MEIRNEKPPIEHTLSLVNDELWTDRLVAVPPHLANRRHERLEAIANNLLDSFPSITRQVSLDVECVLLEGARSFVDLLRRHGAASELSLAIEQSSLALASAQEQRFSPLRERLRQGQLRGEELKSLLLQHSSEEHPFGDWQLDGADCCFDLLLESPKVKADHPQRTDDMLRYEPTSVRALLQMADTVGLGPQDVFCDLGSGFSRVPALLSLVYGAHGIGVEYCDYLHHAALEIKGRNRLWQVEPILGDARQFDFSRANVFFMFNPFVDPILDDVLGKLQARMEEGRAGGGRVNVASLGHCTEELAQRWDGRVHELTNSQGGRYAIRVFEAL